MTSRVVFLCSTSLSLILSAAQCETGSFLLQSRLGEHIGRTGVVVLIDPADQTVGTELDTHEVRKPEPTAREESREGVLEEHLLTHRRSR